MKKVAVILSGCGVYDGAEINEAVLSLLALEENGAAYQCFAPDVEQHHVINHLTGEEMGPARNVLVEAARIARGNIKPVTALLAADYDAVLLPGGFGAAKNLSDFAFKGADCSLEAQTGKALRAFADAGKPMGFVCIAPALIPRIFSDRPRLTIGTDAGTAAAIEAMGGVHLDCPVESFVVDEKHKIVSTPAYMLAGSVLEAATGIRAAVKALLALV